MRSEQWENESGWSLLLLVRPGIGARVSLSLEGHNRLYDTYEWYETGAAEAKAEALVALGNMHKVLPFFPRPSIGVLHER